MLEATQPINTHTLRARADQADRYGEIGNSVWLRGAANLIDDLCQKMDGSIRVASEALYEVQKLKAFKDYVHQRLDEAGIPTHPDGPHSAAGCRIGDRLDLLIARSAPTNENKP